jgi:hypothetical protein
MWREVFLSTLPSPGPAGRHIFLAPPVIAIKTTPAMMSRTDSGGKLQIAVGA